MALLAAAAIRAAIRDVVEDAAGTVRTITDGTYEPGASEGLTPRALASKALSDVRVEVGALTNIHRHESSPPIGGSFQLLEFDVDIEVIRSVTAIHNLSDTTRAALKDAAAVDCSQIEQALTWPSNLAQDSSANATGLVSGMLIHTGSVVQPLELPDGQAGRLVSVHSFTGIAKVATAIS